MFLVILLHYIITLQDRVNHRLDQLFRAGRADRHAAKSPWEGHENEEGRRGGRLRDAAVRTLPHGRGGPAAARLRLRPRGQSGSAALKRRRNRHAGDGAVPDGGHGVVWMKTADVTGRATLTMWTG